MDAFLVSGPCRIAGELAVSGAKNAALPAVAAALLSDRPVALDRLPPVADIRTMKRLLSGMGVAIATLAGNRRLFAMCLVILMMVVVLRHGSAFLDALMHWASAGR